MAKRTHMKRIKKGQSCGTGFERVTIKIGKRVIRGCIRIGGKTKHRKYPWWEKVLDVASGMSI